MPRCRPDIRAQLTGSFTDVDHRKGSTILPTARRSQASWSAYLTIARVTRHGISSADARTTTPWRSRRDPTERSAAFRARRKATAADTPTKLPAVARYRRPADRRSRPQQWADAVQTLADLLERFQEWRDNLPFSLANSTTAEALDAVLELRGYVEKFQAAELPKGFRRD